MRSPDDPADPELDPVMADLLIEADGPPRIRTEREALAARGELEDPELAGIVSGLGAVADRAQARANPPRVAVNVGDVTELSRLGPASPAPGNGGGIPSQVAQFVMSTTGKRKPLTPQEGTAAEPSPFPIKGPSEEDRLTQALEFAKKRAFVNDLGTGLAEQLEIANGKYDPARFRAYRERNQAPVTEAQAKIEAAKRFVAEKMERDRRFAQDATENERADRMERTAAEKLKYDRQRQGEADALDKRKTEAEIARIQAETDRANRRSRGGGAGGAGAKPPKLAQIPAEQAGALGELEAGGKEVDALEKDWSDLASHWTAPIAQFLPGTDAKRFDDSRLAAAQRIGTIIEQGKLTDSDLKDKYVPLMPAQSDSKERKDAKLARLRRMLEDSRSARISGLDQAGFNTSGIRRTAPTPQPGPRSLDEPTGKQPVRYKRSPDGKRRVPIYADGSYGPEEAVR